MENETDLFLEGLGEENTQAADSTQAEGSHNEPEGEDNETNLRNRRERRLAAKLQTERESSIALAARLQALTEAHKAKDEDPEHLRALDRIFGTDTPEAATATDLLRNALKGVGERAREEAIETFRAEQRQMQEAVRKEESDLDSMIEEIEDEYDTTLSKDQQRGFFTLMQKLSPKDNNGDIIQYADHRAVFEEYQERMKRSGNSKAKDLASRSMTQSGAGGSQSAAQDAELAWLKSEGII